MKSNDELMHRCADGVASPDELSAFAALLQEDSQLRARYLDLMNLDIALSAIGAAEEVTASISSQPIRRAGKRPVAAAAAVGMLIGLFGASAVWAVATGKLIKADKIFLTDASFEQGNLISSSRVPLKTGRWEGDPCTVVEAQDEVIPREGDRMLKVLASSNTGDFSGSKNMAADLWQTIDLPGNGARTVSVRVWFNAATKKQARFQIAAVAGQDAAQAQELWEQRNQENTPLPFARTTMDVDHDPATWEPGELTLRVPPQARVLVIGIAAYRLPDEPENAWFPAQFVDDVSVSYSEEVQP